MRVRIRVHEIEHGEDLRQAYQDIARCGGSVVSVTDIDYEGEQSACFEIECEDKKAFLRMAKEDLAL